jgi:hypothetical protein
MSEISTMKLIIVTPEGKREVSEISLQFLPSKSDILVLADNRCVRVDAVWQRDNPGARLGGHPGSREGFAIGYRDPYGNDYVVITCSFLPGMQSMWTKE